MLALCMGSVLYDCSRTQPFPFLEAVGIFALAAILTHFSIGRGWRIVQVVGLQALGFGCAALWATYAVYHSSYPLFGMVWLIQLFNRSRTPLEWINLILTLFWILLFWISGVTLARRSRSYSTVCSRFDIGLTIFFLLYLTKLVIRTKGGIRIDDPVSPVLIFPFFLFGLLTIGLVRIEKSTPKGFLPGYQGIGIIASFASVLLLSAASLILFFLPGLTLAAGMGYRVLKSGAGSLLLIIEPILRFLLMPRNLRPEPAGISPQGDASNWVLSTGGWCTELLEKILKWGAWGVGVLFLLVMLGVLIFYVIKWLFSRTALIQRNAEESETYLPWYVRLWAALVSFYRRILNSVRGYDKAVDLYFALLCWGRHSGLPRFVSETPLEFGRRLNHYFPHLKTEIDLIVSAFNREVYGETILSGERLVQTWLALRTLQSPLHWPLRLKVRFFSPGGRRAFNSNKWDEGNEKLGVGNLSTVN